VMFPTTITGTRKRRERRSEARKAKRRNATIALKTRLSGKSSTLTAVMRCQWRSSIERREADGGRRETECTQLRDFAPLPALLSPH
jgi:hypothetical protein